ncbi:MAG: hypothetical protein GY861_03490, partial [bacterium]|nr:hypothetical protein [bacterium]
MVKVDINEGKPFCFQCHRGLTLGRGSKRCLRTPRRWGVRYCLDYYLNGRKIYCNVCRSGTTLSQSRRRCLRGRRVKNCVNGQIVSGKAYCFNCRSGSIGVLDDKLMIYKKCISCKEYLKNRKNDTELVTSGMLPAEGNMTGNITANVTDMGETPRNATEPPRNATEPPRNATEPPRNATEFPRNATEFPRNATEPPRNAT